MIQRILSEKIKQAANEYPVVTLTGPRQSGKTTLVKMVFPHYKYVSLEDHDFRTFAKEDPRGFLNQFDKGVILDEVQRTPDLFSYIQSAADESGESGRYILTGSRNFLVSEKISQSLAGRTAIFYLLPFSKKELFNEPAVPPDKFPLIQAGRDSYPDLWQTIFTGFYPRIHDRKLDAHTWLRNYYQTYIERDVRSVINIGDLDTFGRFVRLCAGRVGQLINHSSLASDCGISVMTAKRWLSVLQGSFIIMPLMPYFENFSKRIIKSSKLYFLDTGLLTMLLNIREAGELPFHAQKGPIFESFVFSELYKSYLNFGLLPKLYFWRDVKGHEVDFLIEKTGQLTPIETKSSETVVREHFSGLQFFSDLTGNRSGMPVLIYGGKENYIRHDIQLLSWQNL